mmetsp:Transcript_14027/g.37749  ORF Transcript_14027/g.37749 Transcript_14027/m.37749 type:complete len:118 (-) Transcript_14027:209-562(-)
MVGLGMGMRPPNYWKTLDVVNTGSTSLEVTVHYGDDNNGHEIITVTETLAPGQELTYPEESYDEGGWESVATVHDFSVSCLPGGRHPHTFSVHPAHGIERIHGVSLTCQADTVTVEM